MSLSAGADRRFMRKRGAGSWRMLQLAAIGLLAACQSGGASTPAEDEYVRWLKERSMLERARQLAREVSGTGKLWQHPYAIPQPRTASAMAPVWFTAYPASLITRPGESVVRTFGDDELWKYFREIGISGLHTGPMKRGGGLDGKQYTPTIDGHFDRIAMEIDPAFGTEAEYLRMVQAAKRHGAVILGDIIPGHTGKGADFRLAERAYAAYPGIYHMVEIRQEHWALLPPVAEGKDSANLKPPVVDKLHALGYLVGNLRRVIFFEPGVRESCWSATPVVRGVDGIERRWVYLHYFKEGQPTLNWLDPSFAAQQLVLGDALHSLLRLGERGLRLDGNGFLGIEPQPQGPPWSEGHPLAVTANQLIAGLVRKMGGFTFQELILTLEDIQQMNQGGADLSYDFVNRPAYHHALVTGDTSFLRLMMKLMRDYHIDPASLIHAMQNHDELTLELVHFWTLHAKDRFTLGGEELSGTALRDRVRAEMHGKLLGEGRSSRISYNMKTPNGVACTSASLIAATLGIRDISQPSAAERARIQQAHLLLAMYNALQPGVFALSGWDLVGALPLPASAIKPLLADGDTRWIHRGAYDLLGVNAQAKASSAGLPRAVSLYGTLPEQLKRPDSFVSQLRRILKVREQHRLYQAVQLPLPETKARGLLVMLHELPAGGGLEITALNFGAEPITEEISLPAGRGGAVHELLEDKALGDVAPGAALRIELAPYQGKAFLVR